MFGVFVPLENCHSFVEVTITGKELHILTNTRHLLPLSSEGSLTCHIYCDTGQPFKMVTSEDPWHSHLGCGALTTCFNDLGLYRPGIEPRFTFLIHGGMSDIVVLNQVFSYINWHTAKGYQYKLYLVSKRTISNMFYSVELKSNSLIQNQIHWSAFVDLLVVEQSTRANQRFQFLSYWFHWYYIYDMNF